MGWINALATREKGDVRRARSPKFYNLTWEYQTTEATDVNGGDPAHPSTEKLESWLILRFRE